MKMGNFNSQPQPTSKTVALTLITDRFYRFHGRGIGTFILKGGQCGNFRLENGNGDSCVVQIQDQNGAVLFPPGEGLCVGAGTTITVQDNAKEDTEENADTSDVIYSQNGLYDWRAGDFIHVRANTQQLQAFGMNKIHLTGPHIFVVTGSTEDTNLEYSGSGKVFVYGDLSKLKQTGNNGEIKVRGSAKNVIQIGEGCRLEIVDVTGNLKQSGPSKVEVKGNVDGDMEVEGGSETIVRGYHGGVLELNEASKMQIGI